MQTNSIASQREAREFRAFQLRVEGMSSHLQEMQSQIHEMQTQVMKDDQRMAKLLWVNGMLRDPWKHELQNRLALAIHRCIQRRNQVLPFPQEEEGWRKAIECLGNYQFILEQTILMSHLRGAILGKP